MRLRVINEEVTVKEYLVSVNEDECETLQDLIDEAIAQFNDGSYLEEETRDIIEERIVAIESEEGDILDRPEDSVLSRSEETRLLREIESYFTNKCGELGYSTPSRQNFINFLKKTILERLKEEI